MSRPKTKVIPQMLFAPGEEVRGLSNQKFGLLDYDWSLIGYALVKAYDPKRNLVRLFIPDYKTENQLWFDKYGLVDIVDINRAFVESLSVRYDDPEVFI